MRCKREYPDCEGTASSEVSVSLAMNDPRQGITSNSNTCKMTVVSHVEVKFLKYRATAANVADLLIGSVCGKRFVKEMLTLLLLLRSFSRNMIKLFTKHDQDSRLKNY